MIKKHSFHIPVMGIGFTIDTPLKVAHLGIDSVISLVDDMLLEKLRKVYSDKFEIPYTEISDKIEDFRAKRITSYLNLINGLVEKKFENLKASTLEKGQEFKEYLNLLPDTSKLKEDLTVSTEKYLSDAGNWLKNNLSLGSIDVNIMTKIDKDNFKNGEQLPVEFNDAHAALRGFANSDLSSSLILSAGMNPRLYGYMENFKDFFPDVNGAIKKKIVLKVSDYRSALIQGKFLAKKGLWVSEFRIESGLNCGGHAFATDGFLMGPILAEFKENRDTLIQSVHEILVSALESKGRTVPNQPIDLKVTAQGGVGTSEEHDFLLNHYELNSIGWGSPFLLVPEATVVDPESMDKLKVAKEKDLYLSDISPLGVPFNSLEGNTKDIEKLAKAAKGRPGSSCPKKYLALAKDADGKNICTASRKFQHLKLKALDAEILSEKDHAKKYEDIIVKSCICVGLGTSALLENDLDTKKEGEGVSICPGPNMAYFSKTLKLKEMIGHIYGKQNVIERTDRPNMFIKELDLYLDYLKNRIAETNASMNKKQEKYLTNFSKNLLNGIQYYDQMFKSLKSQFEDSKLLILQQLELSKQTLEILDIKIDKLKMQAIAVKAS